MSQDSIDPQYDFERLLSYKDTARLKKEERQKIKEKAELEEEINTLLKLNNLDDTKEEDDDDSFDFKGFLLFLIGSKTYLFSIVSITALFCLNGGVNVFVVFFFAVAFCTLVAAFIYGFVGDN